MKLLSKAHAGLYWATPSRASAVLLWIVTDSSMRLCGTGRTSVSLRCADRGSLAAWGLQLGGQRAGW
jgi:hypothetical protein